MQFLISHNPEASLAGRQSIAIPIRERLLVRFNAAFFNVMNYPGDPNSVGMHRGTVNRERGSVRCC
jgi:hypothetical protein